MYEQPGGAFLLTYVPRGASCPPLPRPPARPLALALDLPRCEPPLQQVLNACANPLPPVRQTYELWFKQVLHEVSSVLELFASPKLDDTALSLVEQRMGRVNEIFKILADQFRVLLTMSPDQFLSFRKHLGSSSGFQSLQFRTLELKLGLRDESRAAYAKSFRQALGPLAEELRANTAGCPEGGGSLVQLVDQWLSRMPFLKLGSFDWWVEYEQAANKMFDEDERRALSQAGLSATEQSELRARMAATRSEFGVIFQEEEYNKQGRRLSYPAFKAALLINLYHDEPILQVPFQVLLRLIEVDEGLSNWRWRHATMVKRMLGSKLGTGGSGGYSYLQQTTSEAYRVFSDLSNISTYMLPKDSLPSLPSAIESAMGFAYVDSSGSPSPKRPRKQ